MGGLRAELRDAGYEVVAAGIPTGTAPIPAALDKILAGSRSPRLAVVAAEHLATLPKVRQRHEPGGL